MPKKLDNATSKLSKPQQNTPMNLLTKKNPKARQHSFKLYPGDEMKLEALRDSVQEHYAGRVLNKTDIIRMLLALGMESLPKEMAKIMQVTRA